MKYDKFGQAYTNTNEICDLLYKDPTLDLAKFTAEDWDEYNSAIDAMYAPFPKVQEYHSLPDDYNIGAYDRVKQSNWYMPDEYKTFDIAEYVLHLCKTEEELQRVGKELLLFYERDLENLLRYMKYMVDTLRKNNVVIGLGRGSSTASYVLYLLGVHKVNALFYDLDITEFLKNE